MAPEFETGRVRAGAGRTGRGPDQDAVRVSHHQGDREDSRTHALHRRGPASASGGVSSKRAEAETERRARDLGESLKHRKNDSDDELRKFADNDSVFYNTTDWISRGDSVPGVGANPRFSELACSRKDRSARQDARLHRARGSRSSSPSRSGPRAPRRLKRSRRASVSTIRRSGDRRKASTSSRRSRRSSSSGTTLAQVARATRPRSRPRPSSRRAVRSPRSATRRALGRGLPDAAGTGRAAGPGPGRIRSLSRADADDARIRRLLEAQRADILDSLKSREADRLIRATLQQMRAEKKVEINEELLKSFLPETGARG